MRSKQAMVNILSPRGTPSVETPLSRPSCSIEVASSIVIVSQYVIRGKIPSLRYTVYRSYEVDVMQCAVCFDWKN